MCLRKDAIAVRGFGHGAVREEPVAVAVRNLIESDCQLIPEK